MADLKTGEKTNWLELQVAFKGRKTHPNQSSPRSHPSLLDVSGLDTERYTGKY
jgi:hypothetical protein